MDLQTINDMLLYNKKLKANLLMWSNDSRLLIGFSVDENNSNILKILNTPFEPKKRMPNIVVLAKDLTALVKTAEKAEDMNPSFIISVNDMHFPNTYAEELWYRHDMKPCFNYFEFYNKFNTTLREWFNSALVEEIPNLKQVPEFESLFTAKASDGIIKISYHNLSYFLLPMTLNILKNDSVSMTIKQNNPMYYIIKIRVSKAKGVLEDIYFKVINTNPHKLPG